MEIFLSQSSMPIIKYVAWLLGWLMNGIYIVLDKIGTPNIGMCIIIFTIILYVALTPIQVKQQKSSKVMSMIQPELTKLQEKYKGKTDQASQQKMNEEMMALYSQYGVSPTGSCLPLLIQMVILFALYQVILYIPGYVSGIKNIFSGLAANITGTSGYSDTLTQFISDNKIRLSGSGDMTKNRVIDLLYMLKPTQWASLKGLFPALTDQITSTAAQAEQINSFIGINITETPWDAIRGGFSGLVSGQGIYNLLLLIVGIGIPVLAWFTQWINVKLMPQQATAGSNDQTSRSMSAMNNIMPLFSAFICFTLNMGIGIYWIVGAVVRGIQQIIINRSMKIDPEAMKKQADEKRQKKEQKQKNYVENVTQGARTNVRKIRSSASETGYVDSSAFYKRAGEVSPDSLTAKANMVLALDEKKETERKEKRQKAAQRREARRNADQSVKTSVDQNTASSDDKTAEVKENAANGEDTSAKDTEADQ